MQTIHEDLIEGILSRLPVKALLRFKCVCKSWRALINHPNFIHTHYNLRYALQKSEGTTPLFLWRCPSSIPYEKLDDLSVCYILSKPQGNGDDLLVNMTAELKRDNELALNYPGVIDLRTCYFPGIANGIVCFQMVCDFQNGPNKFGCSWKQCFGLWNPATRDIKILPDVDAPDQECECPQITAVCFGFDQLTNDFKLVVKFYIESDGITSPIILYATDDDDTDTDNDNTDPKPKGISVAHELYSFSTNSWKRLPYLHDHIDHSQMEVCLNSVRYWTTPNGNCYSRFCIISFNFSTEVFKVSDPPQYVALRANSVPYEFIDLIGLYKDCLAIFTHKKGSEATTKVDIWVATKFDDEDFGVPLEWQCVLVIEPFPTTPMNIYVITSRMDGQLLLNTTSDLNCMNEEWSVYDPETCNSKNLGIRCRINCSQYVESLFPLSRVTTQT